MEDIYISEDYTVIEAMQVLDKAARKVLFIVNEGILIAALTDGDIRRWILKKGDLNAKVKEIANYNPKFLYEKDKATANQYMKEYSVEALPVVNEKKRIISVMFWDDSEISNKAKLNIPVVIMAGGFGTRLYPYTKILPKPLIPIGDIPIAEHIINEFYGYGCNNFYLVVNHKKNMIKAYFNEIKKDYRIKYVDEDKPLGTGGGLSLLKGQINTTFILSNCDILIKEDFGKIFQYHKNEKNIITMICSHKKVKIPYGVIEIGEHGEIESMKEKPELSFFTNTGCYIVEPQVIKESAEDTTIGFPDIVAKYKDEGKKIGVYPISENAWMDMGQFDQMEEMRKRLNCDE